MTTELAALHARIWEMIADHTARGTTPPPLVSLATVDASGAPQQRTVVLRSVTAQTHSVQIFTDTNSHKISELRANPKASILIWRPEEMVQLRLTGEITVTTGAAVRPLWDALPPSGRVNYAHQPPPGTPLTGPEAYDILPDPARMAVLTLSVIQIDYVSLAPPKHRRALFRASQGWRGAWLSP